MFHFLSHQHLLGLLWTDSHTKMLPSSAPEVSMCSLTTDATAEAVSVNRLAFHVKSPCAMSHSPICNWQNLTLYMPTAKVSERRSLHLGNSFGHSGTPTSVASFGTTLWQMLKKWPMKRTMQWWGHWVRGQTVLKNALYYGKFITLLPAKESFNYNLCFVYLAKQQCKEFWVISFKNVKI